MGAGVVGTGVVGTLVATPGEHSYRPHLVGQQYTAENVHNTIGIKPSTLAILWIKTPAIPEIPTV